MIFFGHLGITLATVRTLETYAVKRMPQLIKRKIDYRLLLLGSILPDILDKPIILLASHGKSSSGRVYGHSLLFLLFFFALAYFVYNKFGKKWMLTIVAGNLVHIVLDGMWFYPSTLLWPFYALAANHHNHSAIYWLTSIFNQEFGSLQNIFHDHFELSLIIPELVGLAILGFFLLKLRRYDCIKYFLETGSIPEGVFDPDIQAIFPCKKR